MRATTASRTAVLVCQCRAVADGRVAPGLFADPVAADLLTAAERAPVEQARAGAKPASGGQRMGYELLVAGAEVVALRTIAIDAAVRQSVLGRGHDQVVILGAGLDGRAWRLGELAEADVTEVDHPASQADKQARVGDRLPVARSVRFAPIDFTRQPLGPVLDGAGHAPQRPTTWIWEGVVPYLRAGEVEQTVAAVASRSAPGSRLVVNYEQSNWASRLGRAALVSLSWLTRTDNPLAGEPRRSSWTASSMAALLASHGFRPLSDQNLLDIAADHGLATTARRHLAGSRVAVADR